MKTLIWIVGLGCLATVESPVWGQETTRASVGTGGVQANDDSIANAGSSSPSLSGNGRVAVFWSRASNLVPNDTNGFVDIFVHDRRAGVTRRVSVGAGGLEANGLSDEPAISANGRFVAFYSQATNLVPGDTNQVPDIFVHDLVLGTTVRASVSSAGAQSNGSSHDPSLSADGRFVAFTSIGDLVPGSTGGLYVHDLVTGKTTLASVDSFGQPANHPCNRPSISADGTAVVFASHATNLVPGDTNARSDVFVRDLVTHKTVRASTGSGGTQSNGNSDYATLSGDGRRIAFASNANNLVPGDNDFSQDVFVHDLDSGITTCVSVASSSTTPVGGLYSSISRNGRFVAFMGADGLVPEDTNGAWDMFVHDLVTGTTDRVSVGSQGEEVQPLLLGLPCIAPDGHSVCFSSGADLVPDDTNGSVDVYVRTSRSRVRRP